MQETYDLLMAYARSAWRYRWPAIATAWVVCLLGWIYVATMKDAYEARAVVYVDTASELRRLLGNQIMEPDVNAQIQYVRQAMLGRIQLERVAKTTDLLAGADGDRQVQGVLDRLEQKIQIQGPGWNQPPSRYTISYQHEDRAMALAVVSALLNSFVEGTLGAQQVSSETTRGFLLEQTGEYEQRLATAERLLAEFNRRNFDRLPGREGGYFTRMQTETQLLETVRQSLREAQSKRERIDQQISGETPQVTIGGEVDPGSVEGRINQNQRLLDDLLLRFTDSHPDVVAVRESLARLAVQRDQQLNSLSDPNAAAASNNPVYQALLISRNEVEVEIATLRADLENRERRVNELRALIDEMPDVEAELARLNRDYDVIQAQYQALLGSLERERLSREAQRSEQVEFRIITAPMADHNPAAPNRTRLLAMVLILGLGAGGGLALGFSLLKPVFDVPGMLESMTQLPVIGSVSAHWPERARAARLRDVAAFASACGGLVIVFTGVFVFEVMGPGLRGLI